MVQIAQPVRYIDVNYARFPALLKMTSPMAITQPQMAIRTMDITAADGMSVPVSEILL